MASGAIVAGMVKDGPTVGNCADPGALHPASIASPASPAANVRRHIGRILPSVPMMILLGRDLVSDVPADDLRFPERTPGIT
jgi:hypothetical protein